MLRNILIYDQTPNLDPHRRAQTQLPPIAAGRRRSPSFAEPSLTFYWGSRPTPSDMVCSGESYPELGFSPSK
jgi:hypothetical protein